MKKVVKAAITFIFAILLVASLYIFSDWFSKTTGYIIDESPEMDLARCLALKKVKIYGADSCPDCSLQKKLFKDEAFKILNYINCSESPIQCKEIKSVPAWEINNSLIYGIRNLNELRYLSKCY